MSLIIPFESIAEADRPRVGGKAYTLSVMARTGAKVPPGVCVTVDAYRQYVRLTGLAERIRLELSRKNFTEMRWEEIWDASLRIRNMFITTPLPQPLYRAISGPLLERFGDTAVVVRSSSPDEDSRRVSFAGLHESFVNIRGNEEILDHVRLVWASLWSDAALLYRRELGLNVSKSSMAVVVQEIVEGERSGVAFSRDPNNENRAVIEAVHGLNQGLVDGTIEPDRWLVDRKSSRIISHFSAVRENRVIAHQRSIMAEPLPTELSQRPPLDEKEILNVYQLLVTSEEFFGSAQDIEWTIKGQDLYLLQSRPITTNADGEDSDKRPWYLSLRRSFDNLQRLRSKIEADILPSMIAAADEMAVKDLIGLAEQDLKSEVIRRIGIYNSWVDVYWKDLIPFAHGIRLFGIAYNDALKPKDPYEFMNLLAATEMEGVERNRMLLAMASLARRVPHTAWDLKKHLSDDSGFQGLLRRFIERFGDLSCGTKQCAQGSDAITDLVIELASVPEDAGFYRTKDPSALKQSFLDRFEGQERVHEEELLELARASYRTRDNDNIYLDRIKGQTIMAIDDYRRRFSKDDRITDSDVRRAVDEIRAPDSVLPKSPEKEMKEKGFRAQARQITGQPAGPGIARGKARVIADASDLRLFKAGEVLVCDAIDPSITFIVPLASAIVERRGGMLIHGAIIAREYGLACVTGIPDATMLIHTGDIVTVDGYLGIVTIEQKLPDYSGLDIQSL
jgi:phosphohistidine swiveling domain-containing protein